MEYGLTENGFIAKSLSVILDEERSAYKERFGDDIDISDDSVAGKYIGNQVAKFAQLWELLDGLWSIGDADSAKAVILHLLIFADKEAWEGDYYKHIWKRLRGWGQELPTNGGKDTTGSMSIATR